MTKQNQENFYQHHFFQAIYHLKAIQEEDECPQLERVIDLLTEWRRKEIIKHQKEERKTICPECVERIYNEVGIM